ncbi:hypothetical protein GGR50DRAFT_446632 [Xylaria sp. CBS 124048]|nr:hypothetical protein GGR50DRAFT_446632 [Xylaria sp. CBS 124048]
MRGSSSTSSPSRAPSNSPTPAPISQKGTTTSVPPDWLSEAKVRLAQDLNTTLKELDLIKLVLEDLEQLSPTTTQLNAQTEQIESMRACQEYTQSQCHLLRSRLRQIHIWARRKTMGQQVPERAPEEWKRTDLGWRRWLGEQTARKGHTEQQPPARGDRASPHPGDPPLDVIWGPLPYILSADIWLRGG